MSNAESSSSKRHLSQSTPTPATPAGKRPKTHQPDAPTTPAFPTHEGPGSDDVEVVAAYDEWQRAVQARDRASATLTSRAELKDQAHEHLLKRSMALGEAKAARRMAGAAVATFVERANASITPACRKVMEALTLFGPRHVAYSDVEERWKRLDIAADAADKDLGRKTAAYRTAARNGVDKAAASQAWRGASEVQEAISVQLEAVRAEAKTMVADVQAAAGELQRSHSAWDTLVQNTRPSAAVVNEALTAAITKLDEVQRSVDDSQKVEGETRRLWDKALVAWQQADELVEDKKRAYRTLLERTSLAGAIAAGAAKATFPSVGAGQPWPLRRSWPPGSSSQQVATPQQPHVSPQSVPRPPQQAPLSSPLQAMSERRRGKRRAESTASAEEGQPLVLSQPPPQHSMAPQMVAAEGEPTLAQWDFVNRFGDKYEIPSAPAATTQRPRRRHEGNPRRAKASVRPEEDPDSPSPFAFNMPPLPAPQPPVGSKKEHWRALGREAEGAPSELSATAPHPMAPPAVPPPHSQPPHAPLPVPAQSAAPANPAPAASSKQKHYRALGRVADGAHIEVGQPQAPYPQPPPHSQPPPHNVPPPQAQPPSMATPSDLYTYAPLSRPMGPPPPTSESSKRKQLRALGKGEGGTDPPSAPGSSAVASSQRTSAQQAASAQPPAVASVPPGATTQRRLRRLAKAPVKDLGFAVPALPARLQPAPANQAAPQAAEAPQAVAGPNPQLGELALAEWQQYVAAQPAQALGAVVPQSNQPPASTMHPPVPPEMLAAAQSYAAMDHMELFHATDPARRRAGGTGSQLVAALTEQLAAAQVQQGSIAPPGEADHLAWIQAAAMGLPGQRAGWQGGGVNAATPNTQTWVQAGTTAPPEHQQPQQKLQQQEQQQYQQQQQQQSVWQNAMATPVQSDTQPSGQPAAAAPSGQQPAWQGGMAMSAESSSQGSVQPVATVQSAPHQQPVWQGGMATPVESNTQQWVQPSPTAPPAQQPMWQGGMSTPAASEAQASAQTVPMLPPQQTGSHGGMATPQVEPHTQMWVQPAAVAPSMMSPVQADAAAWAQQPVWQGETAARVAERGVYNLPLPPRGLQLQPPPAPGMIVDLVSPEISPAALPSPPAPKPKRKSKSRRSRAQAALGEGVEPVLATGPGALGAAALPGGSRSSSSVLGAPGASAGAELAPPAPHVQTGFIDPRVLFGGPHVPRPSRRVFSGFPAPGETVVRGVVAPMPGDGEEDKAGEEADADADVDPFNAVLPDAGGDFWSSWLGS
ncbi:uncharacterized protein LOC62_02G002910 [Vanrija pseudolonga]|uniref:Uncharacterized protein n=1 Tax=Vanrija pseudolonga TaxID=143232 RepID=A0AAF0Y7L2_9TREE|nr:hypothetical protein LOC62_02G002910 [Vanrija pseudolonga]